MHIELLESRRLFAVSLFADPKIAGASAPRTKRSTGDFNNDGKIDAAIACENSSKASVFLSSGDGSFQASRGVKGTPAATQILAADIDNDHHADLVLLGDLDDTVDVLFQI